MVRETDRPLPPTTRRLVRSYGLVILIAIGFLLMVMFIREQDKTVPVESLERHGFVEMPA